MKRWVKRILIGLAAFLLLVAIALWWLLDTPSGLRFALARAQGFTHNALTIQRAQGTLIGPLDVSGLRYNDGKGTVVNVAKLHLEMRFWPLLSKRADVLNLNADGVDVALPESSPNESSSTFSLKPPLDIVLHRAHVSSVKVTRAGQPLFASNQLDVAGRWTSNGLVLKQLALQAPEGHVNLNGTLALKAGYSGDSTTHFAWKIGSTNYAGQLLSHGDGKLAHVVLNLTEPTAARLTLDVQQTGDYPWTAKLDAPRFNPKPLLGDSSITALAIAVQGSGDRHKASLSGKLDINDFPLVLQPLRAEFSSDFNTLSVQQLTLSSPQIKGSVEVTGRVQLATQPSSADLAIRWRDVLLPESLAGQVLASNGAITAAGSVDAYHAEGKVNIGPPGKLADLVVKLDGTPQQVNLHALDLKQKKGDLHADGTLTLQPTVAWQAQATAKHFDPGQLFADWPGALDFDLASSGSLPATGPDATLEIRQLAGTLRTRNVTGTGKLHLSPNDVVDGQLSLKSASSTIRIDAKAGTSNNATVQLAVASLGDWLPRASGRLSGEFRVRGHYPKLNVDGQLKGQSLAYQEQHIANLQLTANVSDISHPGGKLDIQSNGVEMSGLTFQRVDVHANGNAAKHTVTLDARGKSLSAALALSGTQNGTDWHGNLSALTLEPEGMPAWRLQGPSQLSYRDGAMSLSELCLTAGDPQLCVSAKQDKGGNLDASYQLHALPLALVLTASGQANLPLQADGVLDGSGKIHRNAAGALSGTAIITSPKGSITYADRSGEALLHYSQLNLNADLKPSSQHFSLTSALDNGGRLDGQMSITGAQQALAGQLNLRLTNLAFVELLSSDVANVKGELTGGFQFSGTLQQPIITGQARIADFAAELPAVGVKLTHGQVLVSTTGTQQLQLGGTVQSGRGTVAINGVAGFGAQGHTAITLKGSQFTVADIPSAKVVVSPDLTVKQDASGIDIGGTLTLDSADVNADKLPGAGATQASPDIVIIDDKQEQQVASKLPVSAKILVHLGSETHLTGMGLDGRLTGSLTVIERPDRATTGQGQIAVAGTYRAYGQNLQIQRGQLLFATTPLDNPGLNIRAVRTLNPNATIDEGQEVGLFVSGTAQRPILTVFSNPVMEQSDALSYLVTGKPLSEVKGGEGDLVGAAAQALGSAAGDLLAKRIGSSIGVDDIGVSSNEALGGSSAFTVGKYLSPRLYLSYGVGLFEPGQVITLRYRLNHRWSFEAQNATDFNRASLNYRYEK